MNLSKDYIKGMIKLYKEAYNKAQLKEVENYKQEVINRLHREEYEEYLNKNKDNIGKEKAEKMKVKIFSKPIILDDEEELEAYESVWPEDKYRPIWKP